MRGKWGTGDMKWENRNNWRRVGKEVKVKTEEEEGEIKILQMLDK